MSYIKNKHSSGHSRPCKECNQRLPTHPDKKNKFDGLPELMDPFHQGLPHWIVCPSKHSPQEIEQAIRSFYANRVKWKQDNGYNVKPEDYIRAGMEPPMEDQEDVEIEPVEEKKKEVDIDLDKFTLTKNDSFVLSESQHHPSSDKAIKTKSIEDYILEQNDANWKQLHDYNSRVERILEKILNKQTESNAMLRTIMRHVGIPDT